MKKSFFISIFLFVLFFSIPPAVKAVEISQNKFVTLIYPVRARSLWVNQQLTQLNNTLSSLSSKKLPSTWLWQYDALNDKELVSNLMSKCYQCENGLFLEVSENLATNSNVSYKIAVGDWARPDKIFLSGYNLLERERLIDTAFRRFFDIFGKYPQSVGVWYIDPYSLSYIQEKYHVTSHVGVSDQFDTDAQRYWGRYWGFPYYPSKYNIQEPANSLKTKLNLVELQWSQRAASDSYGSGVSFSQHSMQANDYFGIKKDTNYFTNVASQYLDNPKNLYGQVTIGLEVGQELYSFENEHEKQLSWIYHRLNSGTVSVVTMSDFAQWYKKTFPSLSPVIYLQDENTTWVSSPCYRVGINRKNYGNIFDLRSYQNNISPDYLPIDSSPFINREIEAVMSTLKKESPVIVGTTSGLFNLQNFSVGHKYFDFSGSCNSLSKPVYNNFQIFLERLKIGFLEKLSVLKFSIVNGNYIFGVQVSPTNLVGFWQNKGVGVFDFPFQTLAKFQSIETKIRYLE